MFRPLPRENISIEPQADGGQFYHKSCAREKTSALLEVTACGASICLYRLMSLHPQHGKVFLRDQVSFHAEAKLIPSGSGKD